MVNRAGYFPAGDEIVDWGVKACLLTGFVRKFEIGYRTKALDELAGGPGASMTLSFYEGTDTTGVLGVEVGRFVLTGMPASPTAGITTDHLVMIDLGDYPLCLADGAIGFGFTNDDGISHPLLTVAPNAALGTLNLLAQYSPGPAGPDSYVGDFDFGAGSSNASLYLRLAEDTGSTKAESWIVNGTGVNPLVLSEVTPSVLGTTWLTAVDLTNFPTTNFTVLVLTANPPLTLPTAFGELLVDLTDPGAIATLSFGLHALDIPKDTFILGQLYHAQGAIFDPSFGPRLVNGIDVIPGF